MINTLVEPTVQKPKDSSFTNINDNQQMLDIFAWKINQLSKSLATNFLWIE